MIGDLSTYSLSQFLMFGPETYFRLYELYNAELWPAHIAAAVLTATLIGLTRRPGAWRGRAILVLLAVSWAVIAWAFFHRHYATINLAAPWMGAGFAVEAGLLAAAALGRPWIGWSGDPVGRAGLLLVVYSVAVHPLIGPLAGRSWTGVELFGLAPDATALGTLGVVAMARGPVRWVLSALPLLWCVAAGLTHLAMGNWAGLITPALGLVAMSAVAVRAALRRNHPA